MKPLWRLNKYLWRYRSSLFIGIACIILSNIFGVIIPMLVRVTTDYGVLQWKNTAIIQKFQLADALRYDHYKQILILVSIIIAAVLLKGIFMFFMRQGVIKISRKIEYDLKKDIFNHYLKLSPTFYLKNYTGDLMNRISEDVSRAREYLGPAIMYTFNLIFTFGFVITAMFQINAQLAFYTLLPLPILSLLIYFVSKYINRKSSKIEAALSDITVAAQESFSGIRVIKSFGQETYFQNKFNLFGLQYYNLNIDLIKMQSLFLPLMIGLIGTSNIIVVYLGAKSVIAGDFTYGNIAEFIMYVNMLTWPVASLGWVSALVQRAAASQQRINEFLDTKIDLNFGTKSPSFKTSLVLNNVNFCYPKNTENTLTNINLTIKKGDKIAIIGKTGSGKSTLLNLITGLYHQNEGEIMLDHIAYKDLSETGLRNIISYVPQETFLFSDSILNNVNLHNPSHNGKEISVLKQAQVYDNFVQFNKGLETIIGERGITLSGGQKQRLALARGFYKPHEILLLDDVFSALDLQTEQKILNTLNIEIHKTVLISTHRMAVINQVDKVIVMQEGTIVAFDTLANIRSKHNDLLASIVNAWHKSEVQ